MVDIVHICMHNIRNDTNHGCGIDHTVSELHRIVLQNISHHYTRLFGILLLFRPSFHRSLDFVV